MRIRRAQLAALRDIIGHNLSVIITLADADAYAADVTPERGPQALRLIGDTGPQALNELRRMLGTLREQTGAPELNPQSGIADLDALYARIRAAGPQVVYRSGGGLDALDRGVQLMVYRIVQEALTNTLEHAGLATQAHVILTVEGSQLHMRVQDTGPPGGTGQPGPSHEEGRGLAGMKERAALYGGPVTAGPGARWRMDREGQPRPHPDPRPIRRPNVTTVLMDIRMPGMDGIEATRRIIATGGRSRILVPTTFDLDEYAHAALRARNPQG